MNELLQWDIYQIKSSGDQLHDVMLRGRIRKFTIEKSIACLTENASDDENTVRFAVMTGTSIESIADFIKSLLPDAEITSSLKGIQNPVLSKLKVNDESRYQIEKF